MIPGELPLIVLAAGAARRMRGRDKLLEEVDGTPLLRLQAERALSAGLSPVIVALPPRPHPRYDALEGLAVTPLPVPDADEGMAASLRCALAACPQAAPAAMVLLADLPEIEAADLAALAHRVDPASGTLIWRAATETGTPGHPIVFHRSLFAALMALQGDDGGRAVVKAHQDRMVLLPLPGIRALRDLDTPEDWADWRAQRGERQD